MKTPLETLCFDLFLARACGTAKPEARREKRRTLLAKGRAWLRAQAVAGISAQRATLNRRQVRAQAAGVSLWNTSQVCGMEFARRKW